MALLAPETLLLLSSTSSYLEVHTAAEIPYVPRNSTSTYPVSRQLTCLKAYTRGLPSRPNR